MKRVLCLLALLACVSVASARDRSKPIVEYNAVQDRTTVYTAIEELKKNKFGYNAGYSYSGKVPARPSSVGMQFFLVRRLRKDNLQWHNVKEVFFRYGETKFSVAVESYDAQENKKNLLRSITGPIATETILCRVPTETFVEMSQYKGPVLFQVGEVISEISGGNIVALAGLGKSIPQQKTEE